MTIQSSVCVEPELFRTSRSSSAVSLIHFSRLCVTITNKHHVPFYYHGQTSNGTNTKKQAYERYTYYKFSLSVYPTIPPPSQVSAWCRTQTKKTNTPKYRSKIKQATSHHHLSTYLRIVEERCVTCSLFLYPVHICIYFNFAWDVRTHTRSAPTATTSMNTTTSPQECRNCITLHYMHTYLLFVCCETREKTTFQRQAIRRSLPMILVGPFPAFVQNSHTHTI